MAKVMIGELRDKVTLRRKAETADGMGGFTETWSDMGTAWAKVTSVRGKELMEALQLQGELTHKVFMRYRADVDEANQITWRGRTLKIVSPPIILGHDQWLEILCKEETDV